MPNKRSSKAQDIDQIAAEILEEALGEPAPLTAAGKKNPAAAVTLRKPKRSAAGVKAKKVKAKKANVKKAKPIAKAKTKTKTKAKTKRNTTGLASRGRKA